MLKNMSMCRFRIAEAIDLGKNMYF